MRVLPISALSFKAGKIELCELSKNDLTNYDSIKLLAQKNYCDVLIEKKSNLKSASNYNIYRIIARRKGIIQKYLYEQDTATVNKNAPKEEVAEKIFEVISKASASLKKRSLEVARSFIK